jgi:hypothetical protein
MAEQALEDHTGQAGGRLQRPRQSLHVGFYASPQPKRPGAIKIGERGAHRFAPIGRTATLGPAMTEEPIPQSDGVAGAPSGFGTA